MREELHDDLEANLVYEQYSDTDEHQKEIDEATDMITSEDVVEQAVYIANAPECCADEHAENMLSMLGANIMDEKVYHDEDECPKLEM